MNCFRIRFLCIFTRASLFVLELFVFCFVFSCLLLFGCQYHCNQGNRSLRHQDTLATIQFGTKILVPKCPDTSTPKCFVAIYLVLTSDWCRTVLVPGNQDKTAQDNSEKRMQALMPLYPYPCYTLN